MVSEGARRPDLATTFGHPGGAEAYRHRPPYPAAVFDVLDRLIADLAGRWDSPPTRFEQSVGDYVEALHSTATLARELMPAAEALDFARAVEHLVHPYAADGVLELEIEASLSLGRLECLACCDLAPPVMGG